MNYQFADSHLINDLNIISDIYPKLNYTITKYGSNELRSSLYKILSGEELLDKVTAIKYLYENKDYRRKLEEKLFDLKKMQSTLDYWFERFCDRDLCFTGSMDVLNNEYLLNVTNKFKMTGILITVIFYFIMFRFYKYMGIDMSVKEYILGLIDGYKSGAKFILSFALTSENALELIAKGLSYLYVAYQLYKIYETVMDCVDHYYKCENFKAEYNSIIKAIDIVDDIWKLDIIRGIIDLNIPVDKHIENIKLHFHDKMHLGSMIMKKLNYNEYYDDYSEMMRYIGKLDELISSSILLENGYSSPILIDSKYPTINADGLWHPILNPKTQIKNNTYLGDKFNPNVMIITGPNKAGKSTYMRSMILSIYLSQTIGVACANKLAFTPFTKIFTYLNIPDCVGRESLFEAELERCYDYYKAVLDAENNISLSKNNFVIGFIDELFTGTNYLEGAAGSYAIIDKLSKVKSSLTILTTHFHEICHLRDVTYVKFNAYKNNNKYIFPYKASFGISNQCIALELLNERGFNKDIINVAIKKFNEMKKKSLNYNQN